MNSKVWKKTTLGDVVNILSGGTPSTRVPDYWSNEIKWVTAKDVSESSGYKIYDSDRKISKLGLENSPANIIPKEATVLIARGATMGRCCMLGEDMAINQTCFALAAKEGKIHPYFLFYSIKNLNDYFQKIAHGAIFNTVIGSGLRETEISLPPLPTQRRIADILSALDEKIELNRQTNATLEAIAQSIFREWFVEFNFPESTGKMVESELGMIPQGWKVRSLYDSATYINGAAYKNIPFSADKSGLPVIKINELKYGITAQTNFTTAELESKYKIENGEILFSWSGSPDTSLDVFVWSGGSAWLNQHIFRVLLHNQSETHYIYYLLKYLKPVIIEIARDKQTTGLGHITVQDMKRMQVLHPPITVLEAFSKMVAPIYDRMFVSELESRILIELRENLLPKLMSGEIAVD